MIVFAETERLVLREILHSDEKALFELDSDPEVHRYLGRKPIVNLTQASEAIRFIRKQYIDNGIGRWALVEKSSGQFIGWSGLKRIKEPLFEHTEYYDLGYRLIRSSWGKGYATESAGAALNYAFKTMNLETVFAVCEVLNQKSKRVLEKSGFRLLESFEEDSIPHFRFAIESDEWEKLQEK